MIDHEYYYRIKSSDWFYTISNVYWSIISDQPIYLAQIGVSTQYARGNFVNPSLTTVPSIEQYEHSIQFSVLISNGTRYYSVVVLNDAYFNQSLLINSNLINPPWVLIYGSDGSLYGYRYSTSFNGTNTIAHPNPNGKLFVSIYGWTHYAGYSYVGGIKLNSINILRSNDNYFTWQNLSSDFICKFIHTHTHIYRFVQVIVIILLFLATCLLPPEVSSCDDRLLCWIPVLVNVNYSYVVVVMEIKINFGLIMVFVISYIL